MPTAAPGRWRIGQRKWDSSVSLLKGDGLYHQGIQITKSKAEYPVIGYSGLDPTCQTSGDTFNDFWTPIGNNIYWFINFPSLIYVKWVWYDNPTDQHVLQQTPCLDSGGGAMGVAQMRQDVAFINFQRFFFLTAHQVDIELGDAN